MSIPHGLIVVFFVFFPTLSALAQQPQPESAWEALMALDPSAVEDPELSWLDRLALSALSPEQAAGYLAGTPAEQLHLQDGTTLAEFLRRRLEPQGGVFVPLPVSCPLFSLTMPESGEALGLRVRGEDLSSQGGSPLGCRIPEEATALVARFEILTESGYRPGLKAWAADAPEPVERVLEEGETLALREAATAVVALCSDCAGAELRLRASEGLPVTARALGYFRPPSGRGGLGVAYLTEEIDETAVGVGALINNVTGMADNGENNTAVGVAALNSNTTGDRNTAVGYEALLSAASSRANTAVGEQALRANTTGDFNTAVGADALLSNTEGVRNTAVGQQALQDNTEGNRNTAVGENALFSNVTGNLNTAVGQNALQANDGGSSNTALGQKALISNTTGSENTALGLEAGDLPVSGVMSSFLGALSDASDGLSNATAIGHRAFVSQSDSLVLGSINGVNGASADTNVGVGTTAPQKALHVKRSDGSAQLRVEEASGTPQARVLFHLFNNGGSRFRMTDTGTGSNWEFTALANFNINFLGSPGQEMQVRTNGDLAIQGSLIAQGGGATFPDYVFEKDYSLMPLAELREFIGQEKHLPNVPSAEEIENTGINMTSLQLKLLEKVEELTLYTLQQEERLEEKEAELKSLRREMAELRALVRAVMEE